MVPLEIEVPHELHTRTQVQLVVQVVVYDEWEQDFVYPHSVQVLPLNECAPVTMIPFDTPQPAQKTVMI